MIPSDKQILIHLCEGNKVYFDHLFHRYYLPLCFFAESMVGNKCSAEDLVQDFFIRFWNNQLYCQVKGNLRSYLFKSIKNACINFIEHQKVVGRYKEKCLKEKEPSYRMDHLEREEIANVIAQAIERLPEQCSRVFAMCCIEGKKYQEVADDLEISINTVKSQMGKAYRILRDELAGQKELILLFVIFATHLSESD